MRVFPVYLFLEGITKYFTKSNKAKVPYLDLFLPGILLRSPVILGWTLWRAPALGGHAAGPFDLGKANIQVFHVAQESFTSPRRKSAAEMRYQGFPVAFLVIVAIFLTRISPEPALYGSSSTPFKRMVHRINPEDTEEGDFIPEKRTEVEKSGLSGLLSLTVRLGGGSAEGYGVGALAELQGVDFRINECKRRILDLRSELYHYLEELSRLQKRRKEILATAPYTPSPPPPQLHTPLPPFEPGVGMVVGGGDAVGPEGEVTLERHVARQRAASSRGGYCQ
eukprot:1393081-Amorphochlora_amoeboformis.AAC.1